MSRIFFDTLGCFKNAEDSERAAGLLAASGHEIVFDADKADIILVNTCGFIEEAKRESIERILEFAPCRESGKKLIVSGCLAQRYADELSEELPEADAIMGVNDYARLPEIVKALAQEDARPDLPDQNGGGARNRVFASGEEGLLLGPRFAPAPRATTFLKIAEGCDNRCAYCAIPLIRGRYRSVPSEELARETERLAKEGAKEIILIAQDVSAYGLDLCGKYALPSLLTRLCETEGVEWIRLMYCYEERITDELIDVMAREDKICSYIDIPLQHCVDSVLSRMNRRSTRAGIERTLATLRERIPGIAIRTTLMTGFPGESDDDFREMEEFIEKNRFERMGVFAYSSEEGTPAAEMDDQIPREIAQERRERLMLRQLDISLENNRRLVGKTLRVLTEDSEGDGVFAGRATFDAPEIDNAVIFTGDEGIRAGDFVNVKITDAMDYDIIGTVVDR
ncbi:MAG: 30S ribosomal protein S12 methylthiotransferase RimO [Clostridiales Family XIII bacterium]|jgi:ribosomal protein S12 methylthiotransferase|nr:30S ribosomal protein S12 methylthiotransferase RimO [Clostridiales Family XIII bacterium]